MNPAWSRNIHDYLLLCIAFTLPFSINITSFLIMLCAANWLVAGNLVTRVKNIFRDRMNLAWLVFFLFHAAGFLLSDDQHEASAIIERRLSLIAFPLLLWGSVDKDQVRNISLSFVAGVITALLYCLVQAFRVYTRTHDPSVFFYHELTAFLKMNAVYMSAYAVFCIHILLRYTFWHEQKQRIICIAGILFLLIACVLLSSKMFLFILALGMLVRVRFTASKRIRTRSMILVFGLGLLLVASVLFVPKLRERFATELTSDFSVLHQQQFRYDTHFTGTSLRLLLWKFCFGLMNEHHAWITGVGTGDYQHLLNERYRSTGMYTGNPELHDTGYIGYGPHNQYIEIMLSMGVPALLLFLYLLWMLWKEAIRNRHALQIQLLLLISFFCMTESVLSTARGIVFFMLFCSLFRAEMHRTESTDA